MSDMEDDEGMFILALHAKDPLTGLKACTKVMERVAKAQKVYTDNITARGFSFGAKHS